MAETKIYRASTTAPVNIAVIKYWGKRDATLNLPSNSSISVTLSQSDLHTHTTATCSSKYPASDILTLNGQQQDLNSTTSSTTKRTRACLAHLRKLRETCERQDPTLPPLSTYPLRIASKNSFPTAAGLASSASGYAALVRAVADLYDLLPSEYENNNNNNTINEEGSSAIAASLSIAARLGSGSACRSLQGGFVRWNAGLAPDGTDSIASQLFPRTHWPELCALILIANPSAKATPSTAGMQATVATSSLFQHRITGVVPTRDAQMMRALADRDFDTFARLTMRDSNSFHAVCLDTEPPIFYMSDVSRAVVRCVEEINAGAEAEAEAEAGEEAGVGAGAKVGVRVREPSRLLAAYTFDAGPNAVIFHLAENTASVAGVFRGLLADKHGWDEGDLNDSNDSESESKSQSQSQSQINNSNNEKMSSAAATKNRRRKIEAQDREWKDKASAAAVVNGISRVIVTRVGDGPERTDVHLLD